MFVTSMYILHRFNFFLFGYKHASYLNRNEGNDLLSVNEGFLDFALFGNYLFSLSFDIKNKTRMHSSGMRTGGSLNGGGESAPGGGGVCLLLWGGVLLLGGRVSAPRGGCLLPGGVCSRGVVVVSQHALRQTPPPVGRITDACKNITLAQLRCGR